MKYFLPVFLFTCFVTIAKSNAQNTTLKQPIQYAKKEIMVPMRDGVKLFTRIYIPVNGSDTLPILIMRSPYSDWNIGVLSPEKDSYVKNLAQDGYIFVYQNIRGKQKSEGDFVMEGAFERKNCKAIDEASDTYDLIDWLVKNIPSNGKVGQLGISYPGELALISAAKGTHPALKTVSPQGTVADFFMGDDYFHNGAFRLSFAFEYSYGEEATRGDTTFPFMQYDLYDWYLNLGSLANVNKKYFHNQIPTWNGFVAHPNYDKFWANKAPVNYTDTPNIPILHVGGFWDQENMNGPEMLYAKMERYDRNNYNHIILGPWCHGQWSDNDATVIGDYNMGRNTADDFRALQTEWFDYYLKGKGDGAFPEAICFQTGSNTWKRYAHWPDHSTKNTKLYLNDNNKLSFQKPTEGDKGFDTYISDPENPIPYRRRPIEVTYSDSSSWDTWLTEDQRQVDHRPDMISYKTEPLDTDVTITGNVVASLFASTTGSDADWVVKVIDQYPEYYKPKPEMSQYELIIAADIFRGRFRTSFTAPQAIVPGRVEEYKIKLHEVNHVFKKGHRIMVQIQSSWFPLYDRNPQKYVPNIFAATDKDFIKTTQSIYRSRRFATCIELPIVRDNSVRLTAK
ncbi:MAG: CocE/NonD family hydrolase [Flavipsychrobacter sp.]|nr:CocE/NonD family hydrolase [Flavipsychrobacter sp.]